MTSPRLSKVTSLINLRPSKSPRETRATSVGIDLPIFDKETQLVIPKTNSKEKAEWIPNFSYVLEDQHKLNGETVYIEYDKLNQEGETLPYISVRKKEGRGKKRKHIQISGKSGLDIAEIGQLGVEDHLSCSRLVTLPNGSTLLDRFTCLLPGLHDQADVQEFVDSMGYSNQNKLFYRVTRALGSSKLDVLLNQLFGGDESLKGCLVVTDYENDNIKLADLVSGELRRLLIKLETEPPISALGTKVNYKLRLIEI